MNFIGQVFQKLEHHNRQRDKQRDGRTEDTDATENITTPLENKTVK